MNINKLHLLLHLNYGIKNSEAIFISKTFSQIDSFLDSEFLRLEGNISDKAFSALNVTDANVAWLLALSAIHLYLYVSFL